MEQQFFNRTAQQTLEEMQSVSEGLTDQQAAQRLEQYGPNQLEEGKKKSAFMVFLEQFKDLLVVILIVAAAISMASGNLESTIVIFAVLIMNAILGTVQYLKAGALSCPAPRWSPATSWSWRPATWWWRTAAC